MYRLFVFIYKEKNGDIYTLFYSVKDGGGSLALSMLTMILCGKNWQGRIDEEVEDRNKVTYTKKKRNKM